MPAPRRSVREGLEYQLQVLEQAAGDPIKGDGRACIACWQLEEDCLCAKPLLWTLPLVVFNLRMVLGSAVG